MARVEFVVHAADLKAILATLKPDTIGEAEVALVTGVPTSRSVVVTTNDPDVLKARAAHEFGLVGYEIQ